jgi:hypothetical protein
MANTVVRLQKIVQYPPRHLCNPEGLPLLFSFGTGAVGSQQRCHSCRTQRCPCLSYASYCQLLRIEKPAKLLHLGAPEAAEIPWHVAFARVGNASAGMTKVLVLAPKLEKKNVKPAARW